MSTHITSDWIEPYPDERYPEPGSEPVTVTVGEQRLLLALIALQEARRVLSALSKVNELQEIAAAKPLAQIEQVLRDPWPVTP